MTDKIKLFRVLHGVNQLWISEDENLFVKEPNDFTGKWLCWYENGQLAFEWNYKNGKKIKR